MEDILKIFDSAASHHIKRGASTNEELAGMRVLKAKESVLE